MFPAMGSQLRAKNHVPRGGKSCRGWMVGESRDVSPSLQRKLSFQCHHSLLVQTKAFVQPHPTFSPGRSGPQPHISG